MRVSLEDDLAFWLRKIMAHNGRPQRKDYHAGDPALYHEHVAEYETAKMVLERYDEREKNRT
jgi:hypothetical protein